MVVAQHAVVQTARLRLTVTEAAGAARERSAGVGAPCCDGGGWGIRVDLVERPER